MISLVIGLCIILAISLSINAIMVWYATNSLAKLELIYTASENTTEIFSMIDTYKEHLTVVYEMPTFYGDETLQSLLTHTGEIIEFLKKYDEVYSFTQPDLEEQLLAATHDLETDAEEYDQENQE